MARRRRRWGGLIIFALSVFSLGHLLYPDVEPAPSTTVQVQTATPQASPNLESNAPIPAPPIERVETQNIPSQQATETPTRASLNQRAFVNTDVLNVRSGPSTSDAVLTQLTMGQEVLVVARTSDWAQIVLSSQHRGWVSLQYLSADRPQPPIQRVVEAPVVAQQTLLGPSRSEIARQIIQNSIRSYSGNCPCPYSTDRAGRRCGDRSAYSRPGGARPVCYESDVSEAMIRRFLGQ